MKSFASALCAAQFSTDWRSFCPGGVSTYPDADPLIYQIEFDFGNGVPSAPKYIGPFFVAFGEAEFIFDLQIELSGARPSCRTPSTIRSSRGLSNFARCVRAFVANFPGSPRRASERTAARAEATTRASRCVPPPPAE